MPSNIYDAQETHYDLVVASCLIRIFITFLGDFAVLFLNDKYFSLFRFRGAAIFFESGSILEYSILAYYLAKYINF
jgi:hypothetical protein